MLDEQNIFIGQQWVNLNFSQQEMSDKEFDNCTFTSCNFSETQFQACKFYECKFLNCNLSMMKVKESSFFDVIFEECKLIGVNWTEANWPRIKLSSPFQFYKCCLNFSSFVGLCIKEIVMVECSAKEVNFREADCTEADFTLTDFSNSLFGKTNLTRANFTDAMNYHIDIFDNQIKKAKFSLPEAINLLACLDIELSD